MMDIDRLRCAKWVGALSRERVEANPILQRVSQAAHSDLQKKRAKAFSEALEKLPLILERVKTAPQLDGVDMRKLREIQELYVKALGVYVEACELGMKQLKDQIPSQYAEIRSKISLADSYWAAAEAATLTFSEK
jgi:hypothetical protein